jgi:N-acetylglutamate synthase-like GNAT family acetyltransferase
MSPHPDIRRARASELPTILALLESARLPTADIVGVDQPEIWVSEERDRVVGVVALERFGSEALLRSLAVAPDYRGRGLGQALVACAEECARAGNVSRLVLLTETAERFFRDLGYSALDRRSVSDGLQQSAEFSSLCPASASCMSKMLTRPA